MSYAEGEVERQHAGDKSHGFVSRIQVLSRDDVVPMWFVYWPDTHFHLPVRYRVNPLQIVSYFIVRLDRREVQVYVTCTSLCLTLVFLTAVDHGSSFVVFANAFTAGMNRFFITLGRPPTADNNSSNI